MVQSLASDGLPRPRFRYSPIEDLASVHILTTRFDEFPAINAAWDTWLVDTVRPPARTSVGVAALPLGASVEIEFAFYREN